MSVAKHLNFTKAACECFIAQTAMSRHIAALEGELGVSLFVRNNRSVSLTPAGEVFYGEARVLVERLNSAVYRTKLMDLGYEGSLTIGFGPYEEPLVAGAVHRFSRSHPKIEIQCLECSFKQMVESVALGLFDVVFTRGHFVDVMPDCISKPIPNTSEVKLVVDPTHPLAHREELAPWELGELDFLYNSELGGPTPTAHFLKTCANYGFQPKRLTAANSLDAKITMVQTSRKVCLVPSYRAAFLDQSLRVISLPEPRVPETPCCVAYSGECTNPVVPLFYQQVS